MAIQKYWQKKIEQDLGVFIEIVLRSRGGDHSSQLLGRIRKVESLRNELLNAELITFVIPWNVFEAPALIYTSATPERCGGEDNQDCLREALETYKKDTEEIISELVSLIDRESSIIFTHTVWQFNVTMANQTGHFEVLDRYWKEANAHIITVCEENENPVAIENCQILPIFKVIEKWHILAVNFSYTKVKNFFIYG